MPPGPLQGASCIINLCGINVLMAIKDELRIKYILTFVWFRNILGSAIDYFFWRWWRRKCVGVCPTPVCIFTYMMRFSACTNWSLLFICLQLLSKFRPSKTADLKQNRTIIVFLFVDLSTSYFVFTAWCNYFYKND